MPTENRPFSSVTTVSNQNEKTHVSGNSLGKRVTQALGSRSAGQRKSREDGVTMFAVRAAGFVSTLSPMLAAVRGDSFCPGGSSPVAKLQDSNGATVTLFLGKNR